MHYFARIAAFVAISALIADASAIRKTLAWRTVYGLEDMILTALAWERREQRDLMQVS